MNNKIKSLSLLVITALLAACASNNHKAGQGGVASAKAAHYRVAQKPRHVAEPFVASEPPPPLGSRTVEDVLYSYAPYAVDQLMPYFKQAGVDYPPRELALIAFKEEKKLEVWAKGKNHNSFRFIRDYDIKAASGKHGPKLRQGDRQVPEGVYRIVGMNPNSSYHLSMKLNYPNDFDQFHAAQEGRTQPGSDIFIHGDKVSAGCLAMGDAPIEELFVLAAHVGTDSIKVVIAPHNPKNRPLEADAPDLPAWTEELYEEINGEILAVSGGDPVKVSSNRPVSQPDRRIR